jgi:hypothetical protein
MKAATIIAIIGLSIAFVMSLLGGYLSNWFLDSATQSYQLNSKTIRLVLELYWNVEAVLHFGSLLMWLVVFAVVWPRAVRSGPTP